MTEQKKDAEKKSNRKFISKILLRTTFEERVRMKKRAAATGLSMSRYAVEASLSDKPVPKKEDRQAMLMMIYELRKLGNNLNQLAHSIHVARFKKSATPDRALIERAACDLSEFLQDIKERL